MNTYTVHTDSLKATLAEHHQAFERFKAILIEENQKTNLTRIIEPAQIHIRHFLDSLAGLSILDALASELNRPLSIVDIGSGAGFPVLPLAIVRPQWSFVSVEATGKKTAFQQKICDALGLTNVRVIHSRAEDLSHNNRYREQFDAVAARAVASVSILTELTCALLRPDGKAVFWKGPDVQQELDVAKDAIKTMGAAFETIVCYTLTADDSGSVDFSLVISRKTCSTPAQYPRAYGIIKKKPL